MDTQSIRKFDAEMNELCEKYGIKLFQGIYFSTTSEGRNGVFSASSLGTAPDTLQILTKMATQLFRVMEDFEHAINRLPAIPST